MLIMIILLKFLTQLTQCFSTHALLMFNSPPVFVSPQSLFFSRAGAQTASLPYMVLVIEVSYCVSALETFQRH